ncbi:MAG TPA: sugar-binding transcriptional regulator [Acidisoma sp.]|nr:sugar-binding transcriptional regulator [Acidisoma sp.]
MSRADELRLIARVARMYHLEDIKQSDIADRLMISQATISRLLRRARDENIVRISVHTPSGTFPELEESLCRKFKMTEVIVAECAEEREGQILRRMGEAAAHYLETTLQAGEIIGISSWSESLLHTVENIHPQRKLAAGRVVQILGGMGDPSVQKHATNLTRQLAQLIGAQPQPLATPGITHSKAAQEALIGDPFVHETVNYFSQITLALVGIGAVEPSKLLADSGNVFKPDELAEIARLGAVGDICLNFFDRNGKPVPSAFQERVIGIELDQLRRARRVVAVAGGQRKVLALLGAMRGGLIDVLVTDQYTAARLDAAES